jgi:site-specific DNA-methyltransferase (adenine-specific)
MTRFHQYGGAATHDPTPCASCGQPAVRWYPDGSPAYSCSHPKAKPYYSDDLVELYHGDARELLGVLPADGVVVMDPPFDLWPTAPAVPGKTVIAFTTWHYRADVERLFGTPRAELVWTFDVGRWVSHSLPLTMHETILVFGETGPSYVGEPTDGVPVRKGSGSVGRDTYATRTYVPRDRRAITTVLAYPRNLRGPLGLWAKPLGMISKLVDWSGAEVVVDPFAGSGTSLVAAKALGLRAVGIEIEEASCEYAANRLRQETLFGREEGP